MHANSYRTPVIVERALVVEETVDGERRSWAADPYPWRAKWHETRAVVDRGRDSERTVVYGSLEFRGRPEFDYGYTRFGINGQWWKADQERLIPGGVDARVTIVPVRPEAEGGQPSVDVGS